MIYSVVLWEINEMCIILAFSLHWHSLIVEIDQKHRYIKFSTTKKLQKENVIFLMLLNKNQICQFIGLRVTLSFC